MHLLKKAKGEIGSELENFKEICITNCARHIELQKYTVKIMK